jgi:hypothetical protein
MVWDGTVAWILRLAKVSVELRAGELEGFPADHRAVCAQPDHGGLTIESAAEFVVISYLHLRILPPDAKPLDHGCAIVGLGRSAAPRAPYVAQAEQRALCPASMRSLWS